MNNFTMKHMKQRQSGAALVIALILLVALSLMAISSMNTASLDLIMAGNEQYRGRAFAAAEAGIASAFKSGTFDSGADSSQSSTATGSGNDTYSYTITRPNSGALEPPPSGNSEGTFGTVYFRITSTGTSERGTTAQSRQELYEIVRSSNEVPYSQSVCATTTNLDSTC